ncbi:MAG TPA: exopolysaccharide biosynthesis polyprenyl glycosylphosphotransferase, partial [Chromatiaceae bacterium]|nr:exopolysaccharide biosynthesis polyprenyl glycosylphosphotransferase [Chromatiaceae bacterium]
IAMGVKLSSPGPVLFKQKRHGWDGKPIRIYKFRTMKVHEEKEGQVTQAKRGDPRITPFGAFLRRTSLDELPQFFNVLQGRMSIVGPRPHAIEHNELYKDQVDAYMQRHRVKPGITGWAQVNGWRGETNTLEKMEKRVEYDLYYIENWSLWFDLKIIFLTLFRGFVHKNAY